MAARRRSIVFRCAQEKKLSLRRGLGQFGTFLCDVTDWIFGDGL